MERTIIGFHQDEHGDWVADLDCGHARHVRHKPPWTVRPWVTKEEGRRQFLGHKFNCVKCESLDASDKSRIHLPLEFLSKLRQLGEAYLANDDPIRQSGFQGGAERWRCEREPILDAFQGSGELLDIGCANGYLLQCLRNWGKDRGFEVTPFGVDQSSGLIELARQRLPQFASNFEVANAWDWRPSHYHAYVYTLWDCVPQNYLKEFVRRLLHHCVAPGGRLILGAYGSRSRNEQPFSVSTFLQSAGYQVVGSGWGGNPPVARFAWIDRQR